MVETTGLENLNSGRFETGDETGSCTNSPFLFVNPVYVLLARIVEVVQNGLKRRVKWAHSGLEVQADRRSTRRIPRIELRTETNSWLPGFGSNDNVRTHMRYAREVIDRLEYHTSSKLTFGERSGTL